MDFTIIYNCVSNGFTIGKKEKMNKAKDKSHSKKIAHVIKRESNWAVYKDGATRASKIYDSKAEAVKNARKLKISGHDVAIHRKDGSVEKLEASSSVN